MSRREAEQRFREWRAFWDAHPELSGGTVPVSELHHEQLPCESLPPLPQAEVKRGVEEERARAAADRDD
jgi:hypothetical protein